MSNPAHFREDWPDVRATTRAGRAGVRAAFAREGRADLARLMET